MEYSNGTKILRIKNIIITLVLGILLTPLEMSGVRAKPGIIEIEQPDGSFISGLLYGDERNHYATTDDGFLIIANKEGFFEYAVADSDGQPIASGVRANSFSKRSENEKLMLRKVDSPALISAVKARVSKRSEIESRIMRGAPSGELKYGYSTAAFPLKGEPHTIVVLVEYKDVKFTVEDPNDYFTRFLNSDDFTDNGATGSCRQYFIDNSMGLFQPHFDLYGPVELKNNRRYYGAGEEENAVEMVIEAVKALDPEVDFSRYDHNNDGYVDNIYVIYAGAGEANGGPAESVWPHSWELEQEGISLMVDGVKINTYGCSNELVTGHAEGIGTYTHEFCHVLGLPDLYNTVNSYDQSTPNYWSILDNGPYCNESRTPPYLSSFERYSLGWLSPREIYATGDYVLLNLSESNQAYIMTTEKNPDEFYMLEFRKQVGWDAYLPSHGMLAWHIDFNQNLWDMNLPNFQSSRQCVKLVCADLKSDLYSTDGDPFPGSGSVTEFSYNGSPKLGDWNGRPLNVIGIYDITETDNKITFHAETSEDRSQNAIGTIEDVPASDLLLLGNVLSSEKEYTVYDIAGRIVGSVNASAPLQLRNGLYVAGGRKIIVK